MTKLDKITLTSICLIGALCVTTASAVDQAVAAGDLAKISTVAVQAKAGLAMAAAAGDVDDIAEAGKRSDAVDAAVAQATASYAEMVSELASGNEDAAQSAADDVRAALEMAIKAFGGVIVDDNDRPEPTEEGRSRGGPGQPYDPVNIYDVSWNSSTMKDFYQNQFAGFWNSGWSPVDKEATPE